jgi:hypothetical protein
MLADIFWTIFPSCHPSGLPPMSEPQLWWHVIHLTCLALYDDLRALQAIALKPEAVGGEESWSSLPFSLNWFWIYLVRNICIVYCKVGKICVIPWSLSSQVLPSCYAMCHQNSFLKENRGTITSIGLCCFKSNFPNEELV